MLALDDKDENAFFGVCDGHADEGSISGFASKNVWLKLKEHEAYKRKACQRAFEPVFVDTDAAMRELELGKEAEGNTSTTRSLFFACNIRSSAQSSYALEDERAEELRDAHPERAGFISSFR